MEYCVNASPRWVMMSLLKLLTLALPLAPMVGVVHDIAASLLLASFSSLVLLFPSSFF